MKNLYSGLVAGTMLVASLASCSRSNYVFQPASSAYHGTVAGVEAAPVQKASAQEDASLSETAPSAELTASVEVAPVAAPRSASAVAVARTATAKAVVAKAEVAATTLTKADHKALKTAVKEAKKNVKTEAAEGKSQLAALLLTIFLGGLGIGRFYLGYTGRGLLYIGLFLGSFLTFGISGLVLLVLNIIDIVKIANGTLKPKNGEYAKTL